VAFFALGLFFARQMTKGRFGQRYLNKAAASATTWLLWEQD
jgi:hypothetical protein